jgi:CrcB protein
LKHYLLVGIGGALGSMLRFAMGSLLGGRIGVRLPLGGTLVINVSACFMIGLTLEYLNRHNGLSPAWRYLIPIGFIGGFSTFSTFEWEAWSRLTSGAFWLGLGYVVVSIVAGFIAVALGISAARTIS